MLNDVCFERWSGYLLGTEDFFGPKGETWNIIINVSSVMCHGENVDLFCTVSVDSFYIASSQPNPINCKMKFQLNFNRFTICVPQYTVLYGCQPPAKPTPSTVDSRMHKFPITWENSSLLTGSVALTISVVWRGMYIFINVRASFVGGMYSANPFLGLCFRQDQCGPRV